MSNKQHRMVSAIIAILYLVVVQVFATPIPIFRFLVPAFLLYLCLVAGYNYWYLHKKELYNFWLWLRIPMLWLAWFGLFLLIPSRLGRGLFLLVSLPILWFFEALIGNSGQQLGWNEFLLSLMALMLGLFGFNYYFIVPEFVFLGLTFLTSTILIRSSLEYIPHPNAVKWVASMSLGLFATELFWVTSFLPLHYSALAIFCFVLLYVFWIIYYHYLYKTLTGRQIQFYFILSAILILIMFISTKWTIIA